MTHLFASISPAQNAVFWVSLNVAICPFAGDQIFLTKIEGLKPVLGC